MLRSLRQRTRDPVFWTDASQMVKTAVAAVAAWLLAVNVFEIAQPFLAPWAALLTVHATVFRTFTRGAQQVGATVLGVLLASLTGSLFGVNALAFGGMLLIALTAGTLRGLHDEATTAAATALVVLTTGYSDDGSMLLARLLDTGIGIGVGLLVNLLVWPPLLDRSAARQIDVIDDRLGTLLEDIADRLRAGQAEADVDRWIACTREIDTDIEHAWAKVRQAQESGRLNPRRSARQRTRASEAWSDILHRLEQAVAESRSMARTLRLAGAPARDWDPRFCEPWLALLERAAAGVCAADAEQLDAARDGIDELGRRLSGEDLPRRFWPVAGALLVNLRNIVDALVAVAAAQPVNVEPPRLPAVSHKQRMRRRLSSQQRGA